MKPNERERYRSESQYSLAQDLLQVQASTQKSELLIPRGLLASCGPQEWTEKSSFKNIHDSHRRKQAMLLWPKCTGKEPTRKHLKTGFVYFLQELRQTILRWRRGFYAARPQSSETLLFSISYLIMIELTNKRTPSYLVFTARQKRH